MAEKRGLQLETVVLDCPEPLALAEFYNDLLGWGGVSGDDKWASVTGPDGATVSFQRDPGFRAPTWPEGERPQMLHLDIRVEDIDAEHERVLAVGAKPLGEVQGSPTDGFRVYADPAGHPFCLVA
ncbi:VOC family protein [Allokutzneria sp. A3M-2-11 16]|uniref:VOC family protein n=1 Tax=Allokutzneria sp. A3M-2-11 16 TaxID=2962043 RepID=UPI0020B86D8B|nr:VOC family protein [Allokutzneria sp. A3M-2-11 16]MCP3799057.1 VOC family protein [Allokutzneria sp. A3M-2-11 16]